MTKRTTFLTVEKGEIQVFDELVFSGRKPAFHSSDADEVAAYLHANGITGWWNSSSMDFADEYGWPHADARGDLELALAHKQAMAV